LFANTLDQRASALERPGPNAVPDALGGTTVQYGLPGGVALGATLASGNGVAVFAQTTLVPDTGLIGSRCRMYWVRA